MTKRFKDNLEESLLCLFAGILFTAWFLAITFGEGHLGFIDLF